MYDSEQMYGSEQGERLSLESRKSEEQIKNFIRGRLINMGVEMRTCFHCRQEIIFMKTTSGKIMPVSLNLVLHYSDCVVPPVEEVVDERLGYQDKYGVS